MVESSKIKKPNKIKMILSVLRLMEDRGISKDFVLQEIKKSHIRGIKPSMITIDILSQSGSKFVSNLHGLLSNPAIIPPTVLPRTKLLNWFYTDVVASSIPKTAVREQVHKILVLNELIMRTESFRKQDPKSIVILPSGDGYAIGFPDTLETPLQMAVELNKLVNEYNKTQPTKNKVFIRSGIESGLVYFMKDLNGNDTAWGPGIIMARRVMDLGEDMHILTSEKIAMQLKRLSSENKHIMHYIGKYPIKWEGELEICNIYEEGKFGNKIPPARPTEIAPKNFRFERVELILDVKNPKTMMTHHTMIWDLVNVSNTPKDIIHYSIEGDKPRHFEDLHVLVTDAKGKKLKILAVNAKNPLKKEFKVQLDNPIQSGNMKMIKLEWDWEEPERSYQHTFSSECKKFRYLLKISKKISLDQKVLKVVPAIGHAEFTFPAPVVKYRNGKTVVSWERKGILANEAYRLEW